jgi:hypothetical protein
VSGVVGLLCIEAVVSVISGWVLGESGWLFAGHFGWFSSPWVMLLVREKRQITKRDLNFEGLYYLLIALM